MKFITTKEKPMCAPGWPQTVGYPKCDTSKGDEMHHTRPDMYSYCCPPSPVDMKAISGINRRPTYRENVPKPRGVHSFYNVMWDGRVRRGDPRNKEARNEEEEIKKIMKRLNEPRKGKSYAEKKAKVSKTADEFGIEQMGTNAAIQAESTRVSKLAIAKLIPKDPEKYMLDLSEEIDELDPCFKGRRLQTLRNFPVAPARNPNLVDAETQIIPGDFFDFDGSVQPLVEKLIGAVLDQAKIEILEEQELATLRMQRDNYEIKKLTILENIEKLQQREVKYAAEKERLAREDMEYIKALKEDQRLYQTCAHGGANTFDDIQDCMNTLRAEGKLGNIWDEILNQGFILWLNVEVEKELEKQSFANNLLEALIIDVVHEREAEYAEAIWREITEEASRKYNGGDPTLPPTPGTSLMEGDSDADEMKTSDYFENYTTDEL